MVDLQDAKTVAVKACTSCGGGLFERDKFCRWCGACQPCSASASDALIDGAAARPEPSRSLLSAALVPATSAMVGPAASAPIYRRVSGPLVSAVVAGVSAGSPQTSSRLARRAIRTLVSVPIWLMIILLSPFDAYAAAKNLTRE